jgi:hypothetical protein
MAHNTSAIAASRRVMAIARHVEASTTEPSAVDLLQLHRTAASNQGGLLKGQVHSPLYLSFPLLHGPSLCRRFV